MSPGRNTDKFEIRRLQLVNAVLSWAENRSAGLAAQWIDEFEYAPQLLGNNADEWPLAPECDSIPFEVREMKFHGFAFSAG
jgi:hypothetical protein